MNSDTIVDQGEISPILNLCISHFLNYRKIPQTREFELELIYMNENPKNMSNVQCSILVYLQKYINRMRFLLLKTNRLGHN